MMETVVSEGRANGIIAEIWRADQLKVLRKCKTPVVDVSGGWDTMIPPRVQCDNHTAGGMAAEHLMERGFTRFAYFSTSVYPYRALHADERLEGFAGKLKRAGFECNSGMFQLNVPWRLCNLGEEIAEQEDVVNWLDKLPKPVGVLCSNDLRAAELVHACHHVVARIPNDVAIVGVGNDELACNVCSTPLSSVDISPFKTGYAAASVIDRMSRTGKAPKAPVVIEPAGVVVRESSDIFTSDNKAFVAAMQFIQDHAHEPIQVMDILKVVPVCRSTLERDFVRLLGRTPVSQLRQVRVGRAKKLLVESDMSIDAIAIRVGFASVTVFSDVFLRETTMRPGEYRKKNRFDLGATA